jgi:hypothetical protein
VIGCAIEFSQCGNSSKHGRAWGAGVNLLPAIGSSRKVCLALWLRLERDGGETGWGLRFLTLHDSCQTLPLFVFDRSVTASAMF